MRHREIGEGGDVFGCLAQHGFDLGQLAAEHARDGVELLADVLGVGLGEDSADRRGDHLGRPFGDLGEHIAQEMHPASLPGGADQDGLDRAAQSGVGIGDDQLYSGQATAFQRAQKRRPKRAVLTVADLKASTSRRPSAATPVAITTACDTTRWLTRALQ